MKQFLLCLLILILLSSCIFQNTEDEEVHAEKGVYPDMILTNAKYQIGQSDGDPIMMEGAKITFYSTDGYALLENFSFYQTDKEGNISITGKADKGKVIIDKRYMELSGNVSFSKESDNMHIQTDALIYDSEKSEIIAEGQVMIESSDGSFEGADFRGDLNQSLYTFGSIRKGELTID